MSASLKMQTFTAVRNLNSVLRVPNPKQQDEFWRATQVVSICARSINRPKTYNLREISRVFELSCGKHARLLAKNIQASTTRLWRITHNIVPASVRWMSFTSTSCAGETRRSRHNQAI